MTGRQERIISIVVNEIGTGVEADEINTVNGKNLKCTINDVRFISGVV